MVEKMKYSRRALWEKDCDEHARGKRAFTFSKVPGIKGSIYEKTEGQIDAWAGGRKGRTKA